MSEVATVKERPILFSAPMVRAIRDGRKTQTRRVVKHHLPTGPCDVRVMAEGPQIYGAGGVWLSLKCPFGQPGDRLWVRETHYVESVGYADGTGRFILYAATDTDAPVSKWTPSIHMPRWASRITLEVTGVRVERLNEISEADARAEGVPFSLMGSTHRVGFFNLWNSINGCNAHEQNPWVWVIEFRRVEEAK